VPLLHNPLAHWWRIVICIALVMASSQPLYGEDATKLITEQQAKQAVDALKKDSNLVEEQKISTLHWVDKEEKKEQDKKLPGWLRWLRNLFAWLSHTSRFFLWTGIAVLVGLVVIFLLRVFRHYQGSASLPAVNLPTHVRDLDIRPESLPEDIGAAVWLLWEQNENRAALALLYRGLLSRLVHQHAVPIKDSSTESQCLELARVHLQPAQTEYVSRTLRVWQFAIYGAKLPTTDLLRQLCDEFASFLNRPKRMEHLG